MAASIVHIPLAPMTLEINAVSSEYVTWTYRWKNVDLSADFETYSQNFGHPDGWVWRMLFQQNVDAAGNRVYGIFLYVVMTDNELQERSWTRDIRFLQFVILNAEDRQLKDKTTVALYRENQLSWGFPGLLDNSILLRDPVVNQRRAIDIVCRLRYHPNQERMRRPLSPSIPAGLSSVMSNGTTSRAASAPAGYWDQQQKVQTIVDPVGKQLRKLLNNQDFSDLEIIVGPQRQLMHAHKAILAARSDWFRSALRPGFREAMEGRITVVDDDPKIFVALLEFLYTGEYPISSLENSSNGNRQLVKSKPDPSLHFSPRSPPTIPPRGMIDDSSSAMSTTAFSDTPTPAEDTAYGYLNNFDDEPEEDENMDEDRFHLFLMADKYGVTQLKTLIRLHLTQELLDMSNNIQPGPRLLKLIRFAFEDLPETTRTDSRQSGRDSGVGGSLGAGPMSERGSSPIAGFPHAHAPHGYVYSGAGTNGYLHHGEMDTREGATSAFGHPTSGNDVGVAMTTERRSTSRISQGSGSNREDQYAGIYGRDNETVLLRESITAYVAKMFHAVRALEGFEELLREGGELGGFVKMVMDSMYRP